MLGRTDELEALRALIIGARNGASGALLIHGDAGVGKTSLIEAALEGLSEVRMLRVSGYEIETALAFGAVQRLGRPLAPYIDDIPPAQREVVLIAAGLASGTPPERPLVGLGMLSIFARAGDDIPTICVIDDAHHLDSESLEVLGLVARRLSAESVALIFASRDDEGVFHALAGVPSLPLAGLDAESAAVVLRAAIDGDVDPTIVADVVSYTGGNPLALRDLGAELSAQELTAALIAHAPVPLGHRLEEHYSDAVSTLSPPSRMWVLLAAAESTGDASVVRGAARALGLPDSASTEAEHLRLVEVRESVRFRHPLVRSAVYNSATDVDRRAAHAALRDETSDRGLREVAAWHAAAACAGPDPDVAVELVGIADLAGARGGLRSRAHLLARAAELAPHPRARSEWFVGAAEAAIGAGAGLLSRQLLARADRDSLDPVGRGRMLVVEAMCAIYLAEPTEICDGPAKLLEAADEFHGKAPDLEQKALVEALNSTLAVEECAVGTSLRRLAERVRDGARVADPGYAVAFRAVAALALDGYEVAHPAMREAIAALDAMDDRAFLDFSRICAVPGIAAWDCDAASRLLLRTVRLGRERGALLEVDTALWVLSAVELSRMNPRLAGDYLTQAEELRRALGYVDEQTVNVAHLAWQGGPRSVIEQSVQWMRGAGYGGVARMGIGALAINEIADGEYASAFARLSELVNHPYLQASFHHIPELVEAAVRSGNRTAARAAAQQLDEYATVSGAPWAGGLAARSAALLADDEAAEGHYLASIDFLDTPPHRGDCARSRLVYGEWLRRMRRRTEAQAQLQTARDVFLDVGATTFAERARRELTAAGGRPAEPSRSAGELTPQETEVARLAARGTTNSDIGSALFISSNTVDYHLRKVFRKLGVTSRRQLSEHFPDL